MTGDDIKKFAQLLDKRFRDFGEEIDKKLAASEKRVISEVGEFIEDHLFLMIGEKADKSTY